MADSTIIDGRSLQRSPFSCGVMGETNHGLITCDLRPGHEGNHHAMVEEEGKIYTWSFGDLALALDSLSHPQQAPPVKNENPVSQFADALFADLSDALKKGIEYRADKLFRDKSEKLEAAAKANLQPQIDKLKQYIVSADAILKCLGINNEMMQAIDGRLKKIPDTATNPDDRVELLADLPAFQKYVSRLAALVAEARSKQARAEACDDVAACTRQLDID